MFRNYKSNRNVIFIMGLLGISLLITSCSVPNQTAGTFAQLPAGKAYAEGEEIYFSHTEASDPDIAEKLTNMMKSPVLYVPSLASVPEESLANVYVFENGVNGKGPLGFQPDVFDSPPGSAGYSPLRQIILVKWTDSASAVELKAVVEITQLEAEGKLTTTKTGVVVNMPFMIWDGGKR